MMGDDIDVTQPKNNKPAKVKRFLAWVNLPDEHLGQASFELAEDLYVYDANGNEYILPAGFKTDAHSIPPMFRGAWNPVLDKSSPAAFVHDYETGKALDWRQWQLANKHYLELLDYYNSPWLLQKIRYVAVTGWGIWKAITGQIRG